MHLRHALFLLCSSLAVVASGACSDQGEGEICNHNANNNGNDDCQAGLTCQSRQGIPGDRCCPPDLTQATTAVCSLAAAQIPVSSPDATIADSSVDGPIEATDATEAEADASDGATADITADSSADAGDLIGDAADAGVGDGADGGAE
jgi:hypothetical protein